MSSSSSASGDVNCVKCGVVVPIAELTAGTWPSHGQRCYECNFKHWTGATPPRKQPTPLYQLVFHRTEEGTDPYAEMEKKVSALMREGWVCQGGICIKYDGTYLMDLTQAMTLPFKGTQ